MNGQADLRTKALVFSVGPYNQLIGSGVQVGIGDVVQSTGTVPVVGEAFQLIDDVVFVGGYIVGSGELYAEHGLIGVERNLGGAVQGLLQDAGLISHLYFRSVHNEAGEDDFVGLRREVQLHFMEGNHSLRASQEYLSVTGHAKGILVDGSRRETVFGAVVYECLLPVVEDGEPFVGDEQQFAAGGRFPGFIDAVAGKAVFRLVKVLEVVACRMI